MEYQQNQNYNNGQTTFYPSIEQYSQPQQPQQQQQPPNMNQPNYGGSNMNSPPQYYSNSPNMPNNNNPNMYSPPFNNQYPNAQYNQQAGQQGQNYMNDPKQFISQFSDNPLTQAGLTYGLSYGQTLFNGGKQYVDSNLGKYFSFSTLKSYFNVNTSYVFNKIKLLLFPFTQKTWKRRIHRAGDVDSYLPPRDDINAPDLYIPMMSFITQFLLYGFLLGMNKQFSPDKLGGSITKGIIYWILELIVFKLGFFFTNSNSIPFYDMISYTGYKYVLLVITTISHILFGNYLTYIPIGYFGISIGYFMLKTIRLVFSSSFSNQHTDLHFQDASTDMRGHFVLFYSLIQGILIYFYSV
eukprot:gene10652-13049_t